MQVIPIVSWSKIESILRIIGKGDQKALTLQSDTTNNAMKFLLQISFIDKSYQLTELGKTFFTEKYVLNNEDMANAIIAGKLKEFKSVRLICQILWGRKEIKKENIINLMLMENMIDSLGKINISSFIGLLNKCKIISYNKKTGNIRILYNPKPEDPITTAFLSPETPYSNIKYLRNCLENCEDFFYWFDKQFSSKGFEPLSDVMDGNKISEVKLLMGKTTNVNEKMKKDFLRFKKEMAIRGIKSECRVILDKSLYHNIHDRWIISKNVVYNIPPVNSIYQGQYAEIKKTDIIPPFDDWWEYGEDIIEKWESVSN